MTDRPFDHWYHHHWLDKLNRLLDIIQSWIIKCLGTRTYIILHLDTYKSAIPIHSPKTNTLTALHTDTTIDNFNYYLLTLYLRENSPLLPTLFGRKRIDLIFCWLRESLCSNHQQTKPIHQSLLHTPHTTQV
jgi:hypothetical protein